MLNELEEFSKSLNPKLGVGGTVIRVFDEYVRRPGAWSYRDVEAFWTAPKEETFRTQLEAGKKSAMEDLD